MKKIYVQKLINERKTYLNHALGPKPGYFTIIWAMVNLKAESMFTEKFKQFIELYNPGYIWKLVE